ncbi:MAG: ATP synthase subunit B/B' [Actinomycetes bacterium]|jgi:vacuolar-type H+-ATPase subunit H
MDAIERVQSAITMVEEARSVPLSASCVVHRGELLEILDQAQKSFPVDFDLAQQILLQQDQILEEARISGDHIIAMAREEVAQMVEQTEIVSAARKESQRILDEVDAEAKKEREEIEAYIDSRLATLEVILNKTLEVISRGRDRLGGVEENHALSELAE